MFLDSDDFLEPESLKTLQTSILKKRHCKVFLWGFREISHDGRIKKTHQPLDTDKKESVTELFFLTRKGFYSYVWLYAVQRKFILEHNIQFPENIYFEDILFTFQVLFFAKKVNVIPVISYNYRKHSSSITGKTSKQKIFDKFTAFDQLKTFLKHKGEFKKYEKLFQIRFLVYCVCTSLNGYFLLSSQKKDSDLKEFVQNVKSSNYFNLENFDSIRNEALKLSDVEKMTKKNLLGAYYSLCLMFKYFKTYGLIIKLISKK